MAHKEEKQEIKHSVFDYHAFASVCQGCDVHTRCVRMNDEVDDRYVDFCGPCVRQGEAEGYVLAMWCDDCRDAAESTREGRE
jgi:hypothetical protein